MKRHIPNLITCMNAVSGSLSVFMAIYGYLEWAAGWILIAMVFDFFDGMAARLLHIKSELGKELDSLADVISFGVAPMILAHFLMLRTLPGQSITCFAEWTLGMKIMLFLPLVIPAFSVYRLAKFNLDSRQAMSFIGMPTPANALFWVTLVFGMSIASEWYGYLFDNVYVLGFSALILSILLISELPMFSLKITGFGWRENKTRYSYFIVLAGFAICVGRATVILVVPLYILFAITEALTKLVTNPNR